MNRIRKSKWLTVAFPLVIVIAASATMAMSLNQALSIRRFELRSKDTLLEIQRALQDFHVAEETYPRRTPLSGAELIQLLIETGHLESPPLNPWTGLAYLTEDPVQPDGIRYGTDEIAETYSLQSQGPDLDSEELLWQLDSTEHHSLE